MAAAQADRHLTDDPVAFGKYLIIGLGYSPQWVDELLTPQQLVEEYPCIASTTNSLKTMPSCGRGPAWLALPAGIRYARHAVLRFIAQHAVKPGAA